MRSVFAGTLLFLYALVHEAVLDVDGEDVSAQQSPAVPMSTPSATAGRGKKRVILAPRRRLFMVSFSMGFHCVGRLDINLCLPTLSASKILVGADAEEIGRNRDDIP